MCSREWTVVSRSKYNKRSSLPGILGPPPAKKSLPKSFAEVVRSPSVSNLIPVKSVFNQIKNDLVSTPDLSSKAIPTRISVFDRLDRASRIGGNQFQNSNLRRRDLRAGVTCFKCLAVGHFARSA